jgi:2-polyprenyl-6-methoxyphenol hydroxylase-like FAD-dependent oxidoreductase
MSGDPRGESREGKSLRRLSQDGWERLVALVVKKGSRDYGDQEDQKERRPEWPRTIDTFHIDYSLLYAIRDRSNTRHRQTSAKKIKQTTDEFVATAQEKTLSKARKRVVVVGAGIAGSLITYGLANEEHAEVICLEQVGEHDQSQAGTGLNVGPNALKCLKAQMPAVAASLIENSLPWENWTTSLADGEVLIDLDMKKVADDFGIRIRWGELYKLLRSRIKDRVRFDSKVVACAVQIDGRTSITFTNGGQSEPQVLEDIDLLIAGDGRYSLIREKFFGPSDPTFLGVCLYRVLYPVGADCPINDYGQWFNGPNRLLAFRVPGDFVYYAGSFPIEVGGGIPESMKNPAMLRNAYTPESGKPSREVAFMIAKVEEHFERIHWARLQEDAIHFANNTDPVLLIGDAAHPMVPTLGQGATQAVEDACVTIDVIRRTLDAGEPLSCVPGDVDSRRRERVKFVMDFSREATDTMFAGSDPRAGTMLKREKPFVEKLTRLYRDVPAVSALPVPRSAL